MAYVQISSKLHSHPVALGPGKGRAVCAWIFSVCWLGRNGRVDSFPQSLARAEFGATKRDVDHLTAKGLWIPEGGHFYVPKWVSTYGDSGIQLWKFGPLEESRPKIPDALRQAVYDRDGRACLHCGTIETLSLDHIHPFSLGGQDTLENLQTLCRRCNSRKGARV